MKKTTLLNTAIAATLIAGSASVFAADHNGDLGDSRIHYPLAGATVYGAATDVWFVAAHDADFYTIDLRAYDPGAQAVLGVSTGKGCGHMKKTGEGANTTHIKKMFSVNDPDLQCGAELVGTVPVTGYYDKNDGDLTTDNDAKGEADFHLCKWRTPDLPKGNYQVAVNSIKLGYHSITENRFNCKGDVANFGGNAVEIAAWLVNPTGSVVFQTSTRGVNALNYNAGIADTVGVVDVVLPKTAALSNKHRDPGAYSYSSAAGLVMTPAQFTAWLLSVPTELPTDGGDRNYQTFEIIPSTRVTRVDHPMDPIVIYPTHGKAISGLETGGIVEGGSHVEFYDPSPKNRAADWYELWVSYDDSYVGGRLMDLDSNPTYNNWYKLIVDSSELRCTDRAGDNGRYCTIEIVSPTIANAPTGTKFNWWVRGWNEEFQEEDTEDGNGWSDKGWFTAD